MAGRKPGISEAPIIATAETLAKLCPDLPNWPQSWRGDDADVPLGERLLECFKPFLLHLFSQGLAPTTLRRHRDHLWMLGGEVIRSCYDKPESRRQPAPAILFHLIDDDSGPLIWPRITEPQQNAFDATRRKLHQFLTVESKSAARQR